RAATPASRHHHRCHRSDRRVVKDVAQGRLSGSMTKQLILAISSSPSATSRTAKVADYVLQRITDPAFMTRHIQLREMDPEALISAKAPQVSVQPPVLAMEQADGVVIATPIFKASYSGLLKIFLDLLPQFALAGKAV